MNKKLSLSRNNKIIAGVCGGIADYFNLDATLIRIIWVMLMFVSFGTLPVILYVVCWAVMPLQD